MRLIWTCSRFILVLLMTNLKSLMLFQIQKRDRIQIDARVMIFVRSLIIRVLYIKDLLVDNSLEKVSRIWNKLKRSESITSLSTQINSKLINMLISISLKMELFLCFKHHRTLIIERCRNHPRLSRRGTRILHVNSLRISLKPWCSTIIRLQLVILLNIHPSRFNLHRLVEETRKERMETLKHHLQCPRQQCLMGSQVSAIWRMMNDTWMNLIKTSKIKLNFQISTWLSP